MVGAWRERARPPAVWSPGPQTRQGRDVVRARLDVGDKADGVRTQVRMLLRRGGEDGDGVRGLNPVRGFARNGACPFSG